MWNKRTADISGHVFYILLLLLGIMLLFFFFPCEMIKYDQTNSLYTFN